MIPLVERKKLLKFLGEDWDNGDVTGRLVVEKNCAALFSVSQPCLLAGIEEAAFLFESEGLKVKVLKKDGAVLSGRMPVLRVSGLNKKIFVTARTALNVLGRMSGVATACYDARKFVEFISPKTRVAVTRKTLPGFAWFDKKAAVLAGADSHRLNLSSMVLLKSSHLKFFPSAAKAVEEARRKSSFTQKIEIEVSSEKQALDAAEGNPDVIMLDNFSAAQAKKTISALKKNGFNGLIELSGGINFGDL